MEAFTGGTCPECGAPVPAGGTCRDNLHALLFVEAEVAGGPGKMPHFYAVSAYGLQHPGSMGLTAGTLEGMRAAVQAALTGEASVADLREQAAAGAADAGRVTRRGDERVPQWPVERWPIVVTDVVAGGADGYAGRVEAWARSIVEAVDGLEP